MNEPITNYVAGFLFDSACQRVALIEKQKPEWQRGKLNGIGGKMEAGETPEEAMCREFREETGATGHEWNHFCALQFRGGTIHFFTSVGDLSALRSMEAEEVNIVAVADIPKLPTIPNLRWLVPMACDKDAVTAVVTDNHMNMTTEEQICAILDESTKRADEATAGPWKRRKKWRSDRVALDIYPDDKAVKPPFKPTAVAKAEESREEDALPNAIFIAAARTDLPSRDKALRIAVRALGIMLASASPNFRDHPTMAHAWGEGENALTEILSTLQSK